MSRSSLSLKKQPSTASPPAPTPITVSANPWDRPTLLATSRKLTRKIARSHYENFLVASILLPRSMRQPFYDVYAFCRTADDLADESPTAQVAIEGLERYRKHVAEIFEGRRDDRLADPEKPSLFVALFDTIVRYDLPRTPFDDLLDAFVQDQSVCRYEDEAQLLAYCHRSANPVGRLVLAMADRDDEENVRLSDEICTALQLANFWQDVARDHAIGRIYLPSSVMQLHGFDETLLASAIQNDTPTPPAIRAAIASQCDRARERFERGRPLIHNVPSWLAADIELFIGGGLATLDAINRIDFDVLRVRPRVSKTTQAGLVCRGLFKRLRGERS